MDCQCTVELQWLEQAWDHENWFQSKVIPASQGKFYIYKLNSRDSGPVIGLLRGQCF